ncbi:MAG: 5-(carboxyamino)imidazole ribonucleotide synthase [Xanthomonadales bacterium]|nr:5-(carboxyamino)imidazole ribonucleotide synthase [Xanthomonadales bacterium]
MSRVGIVGGGQLARMLALAGHPIGIVCDILDPAAKPSAHAVVRHRHVGGFEDRNALDRLAADCEVITFDFENVTVEPLEHLANRVPVRPPARALAVAQDRLDEKRAIDGLGIEVAGFRDLPDEAALQRACADLGLPLLVKTRRFGYDGKGQWRLHDLAEVAVVWRELNGVPAIAEAWVPYRRELSLLAVRSASGEIGCYPLVENCHDRGVLAFSLAPAPATAALQAQAERLAGKLLAAFDYVGVLAVELFEVEGRLVVNEIAPRVHNSGHWSIEGSHCSQFENHLRAICDWPLGLTAVRGCSLMVNVLGRWPDRRELLRIPGLHLHDYGKSEREGRKIGHLTLCADEPAALRERGVSMLQLAGMGHLRSKLDEALRGY